MQRFSRRPLTVDHLEPLTHYDWLKNTVSPNEQGHWPFEAADRDWCCPPINTQSLDGARVQLLRSVASAGRWTCLVLCKKKSRHHVHHLQNEFVSNYLVYTLSCAYHLEKKQICPGPQPNFKVWGGTFWGSILLCIQLNEQFSGHMNEFRAWICRERCHMGSIMRHTCFRISHHRHVNIWGVLESALFWH